MISRSKIREGYSFVVIVGKIVDMEELRQTKNEMPALNFYVAFKDAHDESNGNHRKVAIRVVMYGENAEHANRRIREGDVVVMHGELVQFVKNKMSRFEVKAQYVKVLQEGYRKPAAV